MVARFRHSLRWQIMAIALLPLLLMLAVVLWQARDIQLRQENIAQQQLKASARQVQDALFSLRTRAVQASRLLAGSHEVMQAFIDRDSDLLFRWGSRLIESQLASEVYFIETDGTVIARGHDEFKFNDRLQTNSPLYQPMDSAGQSGLIFVDNVPRIIASLPVERFGSQRLGHITVVLTDVAQHLTQLGTTHQAKIQLTQGASLPQANEQRLVLLSAHGQALQLSLQAADNADRQNVWQMTNALLLLGGLLLILLPFLVSLSLNYLLSPLSRLQSALQGFALAPTQIDDLVTHIGQITVHHNEVGAIAQQLSAALTALQQAESQLVQSQKMVALGSLVAGVSHELNTPIGNCYLVASSLWERLKVVQQQINQGELRKRALDTFLAECTTACEIFDRNLASASGLIRSFKQISIDQTADLRRSFDLKQLVDDAILTLMPSLKRITAVHIDNRVANGIILDSYPGALAQILNNLLQNAAIHGLEEHSSGQIRINATLSGPTVTLTVCDNGSGIPEALIDRIFDPFFTTKLGQGGSGLGLHICYTLANRPLGGTITVNSEINAGTTFTLKIPSTAPGITKTG